jgi:hypothetical protein
MGSYQKWLALRLLFLQHHNQQPIAQLRAAGKSAG